MWLFFVAVVESPEGFLECVEGFLESRGAVLSLLAWAVLRSSEVQLRLVPPVLLLSSSGHKLVFLRALISEFGGNRMTTSKRGS